MRVALEASALAEPDPAGVARYVRELARALAGLDGVQPQLWYRLSRLGHRDRWWRPPDIAVRAWHGRWWPPFPGVDVLHGPDGRAPPRWRLPVVITLHDLTVLKYGDRELARDSFRQRKQQRYREMVARAGRIIAVSEATARDAEELLGARREKLRVVHHGVDGRFRPLPDAEIRATLGRHSLEPGYLLYVGTISERKNTERLVRAWARSRAGSERPLVLAGRLYHRSESTLRAIRALRLESRVHCLGYVPDGDLPALYNGAAGLLLPSRYEGFGLPVLEALACGIPVLCGNAGGAPETAGPCALAVDPEDTDAIADGIDRLLTAPPCDREMRLARAAGFTWEAAARQTVAVYRELIG